MRSTKLEVWEYFTYAHVNIFRTPEPIFLPVRKTARGTGVQCVGAESLGSVLGSVMVSSPWIALNLEDLFYYLQLLFSFFLQRALLKQAILLANSWPINKTSFEVCFWVNSYGHWLAKWKMKMIPLKVVLNVVYETTASVIN